ncbi:hypothetical protein [Nonomuraea sp. WAC 01424]|nr:hypothetical protein [Nonomuraea sp. WAC 01424]
MTCANTIVQHGRAPVEEAEWTRYESVVNAAFATVRGVVTAWG